MVISIRIFRLFLYLPYILKNIKKKQNKTTSISKRAQSLRTILSHTNNYIHTSKDYNYCISACKRRYAGIYNGICLSKSLTFLNNDDSQFFFKVVVVTMSPLSTTNKGEMTFISGGVAYHKHWVFACNKCVIRFVTLSKFIKDSIYI